MISWTKTDEGYDVQFPKELKDSFKKLFPNAAWRPRKTAWEVGPRSLKRLEQFKNEMSDAAALSVELEALQATEEEIDFIKTESSRIKALHAARIADAEKIKEVTANLLAVKEGLATHQESLVQAEAEVRLAKEEKQKVQDDIKALLKGVVDIDELQQLKSTMSRNHNPANRVTKDRFETARARVKQIRSALAEAGLSSAGVNFMAGANINRPDRDGVGHLTIDHLLMITKIQKEEE